MNVAGKPEYRTSSASAAESSTFAASFSDLGIPAGSTINSAVFTYETLNHPLHGFATKALQKGTTVLDSWFDSGDAITFADINGSHIRFVTAKNNTNYPSMPSLSGYENSLVNESRWRIENVTLTVDYTLPYTNCTPPTTLTLNKNNVAPNENVTLSWSGASGGTNNPIAFYDVYQSTSASGTYTHILSTISASTTSAPVSSPSANGSSYFYKIVAVGTVSGYDSGYSAASAGLKTVWTVPSVSNVKVAGSASAIYVEAGSSVSLSWAGTNGTNNPITSYTILRNGVAIKTGQAASPYSVTAHSTVNSSYYFSVQPIGTHENGSAVNSPTVYSYGLCSAPSSISVSKTSVGPNTGVTLSWSGASGGGSYNGITGYDIYRSTSPTSGFSKIDSITTTATSGSRTVTSSGTNGTTYY